MHARHAGVYESPFSTNARSLQDLDAYGIQKAKLKRRPSGVKRNQQNQQVLK
jgi:hypothetical protein